MLFNSLEYLVFLPLVVALYYATPQRARWGLLLAASYLFYAAWRVEYLALIIASTVVDYSAGLAMGACATRRERRKWLAASLLVNLGLLFTFKYANFALGSAATIAGWLGSEARWPVLDLLLPVGISFYTFQTLSYAIDVYRGDREPERHLGRFAVYVAFFPQLVAGPIERSTRLLPQFREHHRFSREGLVAGLWLILFGFFKKLVVADQAGLYVDAVFADPDAVGAAAHLAASYLFAFQLYCDFSGYSDIAVGSAALMGYRLMENFRRPYTAQSVQEFWRRWHISLSTWFRDYVYLPLGGSRGGLGRWAVAIAVVFLTSGLWHGAAWTFVVWGALHVVYVFCGASTRRGRERLVDALPEPLRPWVPAWRAVVVFHLWAFSLIFFRAENLGHAVAYLGGLFSTEGWRTQDLLIGEPLVEWIAIASAPLVLLLLERLHGDEGWRPFVARASFATRLALFVLLFFGTLLFAPMHSQQFIYFQF